MVNYKEPKSASKSTLPKPVLGLAGIDPITYFVNGNPLKGDLEHTAIWNGLTYCFCSQKNLDRFNHNPLDYLPQFDGTCTSCRALGWKVQGSPKVWKIVEGKLYFHANPLLELFSDFFPGMIVRARKNFAASVGMR